MTFIGNQPSPKNHQRPPTAAIGRFRPLQQARAGAACNCNQLSYSEPMNPTTSRNPFFSLAIFLFLLGLHVHASEPSVTGDWSVPVKGMRGRLLFSEGEPVNGTRMAAIHFELQNVGDGSELLVDFHPPHFDLVDEKEKSIEQSSPWA